MTPRIGIYGAARTVTGSKHLLELGDSKVLVDCGMFQGSRDLDDMNWAEWPFDPALLDAVIITHAHLDHIGLLPRLVKDGYRGPIYATPATIGLARISLPDSGRLQEEDARQDIKHGNAPPDHKPLYNEDDAYACLKQFKPVKYGERHPLPGGASWVFTPAGHILGSAFAEIALPNGEILMMSGDLGRYDTPIIRDPSVVEYADYLFIESTYGGRLHEQEDPLLKLEACLNWAWQNGGTLIVPSFAIGRTQEMLYYFRQLQDQGRMPRIPVYVDSPMAMSVTEVYAQSQEEHDQDMKIAVEAGVSSLEPSGLHYIRDRQQSKELNSKDGPMVIIAGSGMCNGGRVRHHLMSRLSDERTMVLFTGYQGHGTLGRRILEGEPFVRLFGQEVEVFAKVEKMNALSAHADQGELMNWLSYFKSPPKTTFIVHGEPDQQDILAQKIQDELGWNVVIPEYRETFELPN